MAQVLYRPLLKMDHAGHPGIFSILPGSSEDIRIYVIPLYVRLYPVIYQVICLVNRLIPVFSVYQVRP